MIDPRPACRAFATVDSTKLITGRAVRFAKALSPRKRRRRKASTRQPIMFDELHAQPDRELWDTLRYAGRARRQPLMLRSRRPGSDKETICGEQYEYAKRVIAGESDDTLLRADLREPTPPLIGRLNRPGGGESELRRNVQLEQFRADFTEAKRIAGEGSELPPLSPESVGRRPTPGFRWINGKSARRRSRRRQLAGRECFAGLDLSATDDTTALVLIFDRLDGGLDVLPFFWLPADNIVQLERRHRQPYRAWAKAGLIELTPGNVVDYDAVRTRANELRQTYTIRKLAIDRKFQGQALENDLMADGFDVVPAGQGWVSQDLPAKELERLLKGGRIAHGGNEILAWHAANVVVDIDKNGNYTINKRKSRSKIDGIAALCMALMCRMSERGAAGNHAAGGLIVL
jgi:phage terminase large subunit-like protein